LPAPAAGGHRAVRSRDQGGGRALRRSRAPGAGRHPRRVGVQSEGGVREGRAGPDAAHAGDGVDARGPQQLRPPAEHRRWRAAPARADRPVRERPAPGAGGLQRRRKGGGRESGDPAIPRDPRLRHARALSLRRHHERWVRPAADARVQDRRRRRIDRLHQHPSARPSLVPLASRPSASPPSGSLSRHVLLEPAGDRGSHLREKPSIQNQSPVRGAHDLEAIGPEGKLVVPLARPLLVGRAGDDQHGTGSIPDDNAGLPLVARQARLDAERFERDQALVTIEIRHRRLTVGIAIDDPVFLRAEHAGAEGNRRIARLSRRARRQAHTRPRPTRRGRPHRDQPAHPPADESRRLPQATGERDDIVGVVGHARRAELGWRAGPVAPEIDRVRGPSAPGELALPEGPHASRIRGPVHEDHRCARVALRQDTVGPRIDHTRHCKTDETGECLSGMLGAKPSESGESVTLGNRTGALVIGVLVLLGHAGDQRPPTPRPTDDVLGKGTVSIPVATKEPEPPPSAEPMPGRESPKPPVSAPPAKSPDSRKSGMPPGRAVAGALAQKDSRHVPANRPPKPAAPAETPRPADTAPRTENAPVTKTVPRTATAPPTEAPAPAESPTLATTLDLGSLEKRLRETTAIGVFTKLSLKNQVDDLLDEFREFHKR